MADRPNWHNPPYGWTAYSLGGLVTLTNVGASYDAIALSRGLGFCLIDFKNVTTIRFDVMHQKVGTGNQDYQLWNETDSTQLGVVTDSNGAGNRTLSTTITGINLTGIKLVRVRARSSVAADDPIYFGAALLVGG